MSSDNGTNNSGNLFDENFWSNFIDYSSVLEDIAPTPELYWNPQHYPQNVGAATDVSLGGTTSQVSESAESGCPRKRGRTDPCWGTGTKARRERLRREKLNDRFSELSAILEPGRPVKTDKFAILGDAIRVLNQLKTESFEYKEMNQKLLEEINSLKAEKNELREEKLVLKADKEKMKQHLKTMAAPPFMPANQPIYQTEADKVAMVPRYGFVPMWHYLTPSVRDTSQDHQLRPPAA